MAPLMIVATVPLYNIIAVIVLSLMKPKRGILRKELILQTGRDILCNPIILGIGAGMLWSLLPIRYFSPSIGYATRSPKKPIFFIDSARLLTSVSRYASSFKGSFSRQVSGNILILKSLYSLNYPNRLTSDGDSVGRSLYIKNILWCDPI